MAENFAVIAVIVTFSFGIIASSCASEPPKLQGPISGGTLSLQPVSINKGFERTKDEIGECITEINAKRQIVAIPPVTLDDQLVAAANSHTDVMVDTNCFAHKCPSEPKVDERITNAGFTWAGFGEIIAAGSPNCAGSVEQWMNSPPHKAIMLGNLIMVGCAARKCGNKDPNQTCSFDWYWTCDFGNRF